MSTDSHFSPSFFIYMFQSFLLFIIISSIIINYKTFLGLRFFEKLNLLAVLSISTAGYGLYHYNREHLKKN